MTKKRCTKCNKVKLLNDFYKQESCKGGIRPDCKKCMNIRMKHLSHTKVGLLKKIYRNQKYGSKKRGHIPPSYSQKELIAFALKSVDFHNLYVDWTNSKYKKLLVPTFDRDNDYKGYSFDNFNKWMTWENNTNKGYHDRKTGINNKHSKAVIGIHKKTKKKIEFYSLIEAYRNTKIHYSHISKCCLNKPNYKSAGGYTWKFKKNEIS